MSEVEIKRLRRRAQEERARACVFHDAELRQAHIELAEKYDAVADAYLRMASEG